jgi:hypothetical protein
MLPSGASAYGRALDRKPPLVDDAAAELDGGGGGLDANRSVFGSPIRERVCRDGRLTSCGVRSPAAGLPAGIDGFHWIVPAGIGACRPDRESREQQHEDGAGGECGKLGLHGEDS